MDFTGIFETIGLSEEFAKVYAALSDGRNLRVMDISTAAKLPRTSCYEYLPTLIELKLIEEISVGKSKYYRATNPQNLLNILYRQKNNLSFNLGLLESNFSSLEEKFNSANAIIKTQVFTDLEEITEIIEKKPKKAVAFISGKIETKFSQEIRKVIKRAVANVKIIDDVVFVDKIVFEEEVMILDYQKECALLILHPQFAELEKKSI